jgi:hypothetical protein
LQRTTGGTPLHEFTHATQFGGGNQYIKDFTNGEDFNINSPYLMQKPE